MATAISPDACPRPVAPKDEVLFAGTPDQVKAYSDTTFGPDEGPAVVLRTPEEIDAFLGSDACAARSS